MRRLLGRFLPFVALLAIVLIFTVITEGDFLKVDNLVNVLRFSSVFIIMGVGMTFVIIAGGIDLSVGSVFAFASVIAAWSLRHLGLPLGWGLAIAIGTGALWGLLNGTLITLVQLPPFIATLATMGVARGGAYLIARNLPEAKGGTSVIVQTTGFDLVGSGTTAIILIVAVVALGHYVLYHTRLGRYTFAIGSNVEAARYSGIAVQRYTLLVYLVLGTLAALAGMIETSITSGGRAELGLGYELHVIAAVVIGGGSLSGGQGTIVGTLTGALIMGVIRNGCILAGIDYEWQLVVIGVLIVIAVAFDRYRRSRSGA